MSDTDNEITGLPSERDGKDDSGLMCASVVKGRIVSTGISFSRLANGRISVSAHDGPEKVVIVIDAEEAATLAKDLGRVAMCPPPSAAPQFFARFDPEE